MRFRSTAILLVVFCLLGGYVYWTEFRGREEREQQEAAAKKAVQFSADEIAELTLSYDGNTVTGARRGEQQWEITNPAGVEADSEAWESLARSVADIQREESIPGGSDLAQFGLDQPALRIDLKLSDGRLTQIDFGAENPRKTHNYIKVSDNAEVLLSPTKADLFRKSVADLRNKKLLDVSTDDVDLIRFGELTLKKSSDEWSLTTPIASRADSTEVSTLLSTVQFGRASAFADSAIDLKAAGLDRPSIQLTLHDAKAMVDRSLLIGREAEAGRYYAKDSSRSPIFIIDNQIVEKVRRPLFEWRDKSILAFDRDKVEQLDIIQGSNQISLKKSGADWTLPDGRKVQWDKVSSLLNTLEFEKAKDIIDAPRSLASYGLDRPALELSIRQTGTPELRIAFGSESSAPEGIFMRSSDRPTVLVVSRDVRDKFGVKVEDLVETQSSTQ